MNAYAKKSTCDVYTLKIPKEQNWRYLWAKIYVDSQTWSFACLSDAGNFSYRWPTESHRTFEKFISEIDMGYLCRKLNPRKYYNHQKTIRNLKKEIKRALKEEEMTKQQADEEYRVIDSLEFESEDLTISSLLDNSKYFSDYEYIEDYLEREFSPQVATFLEFIFPLFQKALKEELNKCMTADEIIDKVLAIPE